MKRVAILVSGGSYNNLVQVLTLVMGFTVCEIAVRLFFRDESIYKLTPEGSKIFNLSEPYQPHQEEVITMLKANQLGDLQKLIQEVKGKGDVRVSVCSSSLAICALKPEDLLPEVDDIQGLTSFLLEEMAQADRILTF